MPARPATSVPSPASSPRRDTLLDFFDDLTHATGQFLVYDDGFRTRQWTYAEVGRAARAFAARLHQEGYSREDKILLWGENRPEWIVAFWGALLCGIPVVPIDYRASPEFVRRVQTIVAARLMLVGEDVEAPTGMAAGTAIWRLASIEPNGTAAIDAHLASVR